MYNDLTEFDQHCLNNAILFTAIRGRRPADRTRVEFDTLEEAKAYGQSFGDGRTIIYAVTVKGRSTPIANI
jgi:hypothetical protein